jgi:hypothetical protein
MRIVNVETVVDAALESIDLDQKKVTRSFLTQRQERFVEEIVAADKDGGASRFRLHCLSSTVEERTAGETTGGVRKSPLDNRILTVTCEKDAWKVLPVGAQPLPSDSASTVGRWHDLRLLVKPGPVKLNETWTVTSDRLGSLMVGKDASALEVRCTLSRVTKAPNPRAEIAVEIRFEKAADDKSDQLKGQLAGTLVLDLAAKKPLSFTVNGSFVASRVARDDAGNEVGKIGVQAKKTSLRITFEPVPK